MTSPIILELIEQLVRNQTLDANDIAEIAGRLDSAGHSVDAHNCQLSFVKASARTQSEFEAEHRRRQMRVVPANFDGGNGD